MRLHRLVPVLLLLALPAAAHNVPVLPSTCVLDPIELTAPGTSVAVAAPGASDQLIITYDNSTASLATFDLRTVPPRPLTAGGVAGSFGLPSLFQAKMLSSGDLTASGLTLTLTVGAVATPVPMTLTTALVAGAAGVAEGAPIRDDGHFELVGASASGVASLGGAPLLVRLACQAFPAPDLDQFESPPEVKSLTGSVRKGTLKLRATLVEQQQAVDLATFPAILRVSAGGAAVAALAFPDGLPRHGKPFVGEAPDGSTLTVRVPRTKAPARYAVKVRVPGVTAPATSAAPLVVTLEMGGMIARVSRPFRVNGGGLRITH